FFHQAACSCSMIRGGEPRNFQKGRVMRFISTRAHGAMDYLVAILLIASPWLFGFAEAEAATWIPVIIGIGTIVLALMTAYEMGVVPAISMKAHLMMDLVAGLVLLVSPWLFGFYEFVWIPHVVFGLLEIGAAMMTETTPSRIPHT